MLSTNLARIDVRYLNSWGEVKNNLLLHHKKGFLFRGHKDISWELNSSLERNLHQVGLANLGNYYMYAYRQMVECSLFTNCDHRLNEQCLTNYCLNLKEELEGLGPAKTEKDNPKYLPDGIKNEYDLNQRAIPLIWQMQHHEINTHYIDFTLSYYIAAYFALFYDNKAPEPQKKDHFPGIVVVNWSPPSNDLGSLMVGKWLENRKVSPYVHERVLKQQSQLLDSFKKSNYVILKYAFHPDWISEIYTDLKLANISGYNLFGTKEKAALDYYCAYKYGNAAK